MFNLVLNILRILHVFLNKICSLKINKIMGLLKSDEVSGFNFFRLSGVCNIHNLFGVQSSGELLIVSLINIQNLPNRRKCIAAVKKLLI